MIRKHSPATTLLSLAATSLILLCLTVKPASAQTVGRATPAGGRLDGDATDARGNVIDEDRVVIRPIDRLIIHKLDIIGARNWWCMPIWQPYWCVKHRPVTRGRVRAVQVICPPPPLINWCWWPRRCTRLYPTLIPGMFSHDGLPPELPPDVPLDPSQFDKEKEGYFVGIVRVRTIKNEPVGRFYIGGMVVFRRVHVVCRPAFWNVYWPIRWRWWDLWPALDANEPINVHLKNRSWYWCWRPTKLFWVIPIRPEQPINHDLARLLDDPELPDLETNADSLVSDEGEIVDLGHIRHRIKFRLTAAMGPIGNTGYQQEGPPAAMIVEADCDSFFDVFFDVRDSQLASQ